MSTTKTTNVPESKKYTVDAEFAVDNFDMDKFVPPANEENLKPAPVPAYEKVTQKITKLFSANYAIMIIVIILLIAIIKFEGLIADAAVVLLSLGAFYFVFLQVSKKEK